MKKHFREYISNFVKIPRMELQNGLFNKKKAKNRADHAFKSLDGINFHLVKEDVCVILQSLTAAMVKSSRNSRSCVKFIENMRDIKIFKQEY